MSRPRAANDFATIRARMEELRREREAAQARASDVPRDPPPRPARNAYWSHGETSAGPRRLGQSDPIRS
jgi:hypothetical protein